MKLPIVYVGMCADILHKGHINILNEAIKYGSVIVGLLSDEAIKSYKQSPLMCYEDRYKILISLRQVDKVVKQKTLDYSFNLQLLKPDYVLHGDDWRIGPQEKTRQAVVTLLEKWGGQLIEVPYTKGISSTLLKSTGDFV